MQNDIIYKSRRDVICPNCDNKKHIKMLEEYREHITHPFDLDLIDKEIAEYKEIIKNNG